MGENQTNTSDNWWKRAACRGMDSNLFVPDRSVSHWEIRHAKEVCRHCSVRKQCLDYAMEEDNDLSGIWGGTTGRERRTLRSQALRAAR